MAGLEEKKTAAASKDFILGYCKALLDLGNDIPAIALKMGYAERYTKTLVKQASEVKFPKSK